MKNYLLVDGYNVMNAWQELKEMGGRNLEEARDYLIEQLVDYKAYTGEVVILVFDAHLVKKTPEKHQNVKGIEVVFTKEHETADSYIEKKVSELVKNRKNRVRVATSDWAEQQVVLGSGATRISARELKIELEKVKTYIRKKTEDTQKKRMILEERLDSEVLKVLEEWRRKQ